MEVSPTSKKETEGANKIQTTKELFYFLEINQGLKVMKEKNISFLFCKGLVDNNRADLNLFDSSGAPSPKLAAVLARMARVEIGPYAVQPALIKAAIKALNATMTTNRSAADR